MNLTFYWGIFPVFTRRTLYTTIRRQVSAVGWMCGNCSVFCLRSQGRRCRVSFPRWRSSRVEAPERQRLGPSVDGGRGECRCTGCVEEWAGIEVPGPSVGSNSHQREKVSGWRVWRVSSLGAKVPQKQEHTMHGRAVRAKCYPGQWGCCSTCASAETNSLLP